MVPLTTTLASKLSITGEHRTAFRSTPFRWGSGTELRAVDTDAVVAQRLKRLSSIEFKLTRFPEMPLSRMQDIGGCRAVVHSMSHVRQIQQLYVDSSLKHRLIRTKDYVAEPKDSGYRSLHLIYRYYSDKKPTYNNLQIEIQIRTHIQHAWATAVETVGTFLDQSLKASRGSSEWLHFFTLMSSAFALKEGMPLVPGPPTEKPLLVSQIRALARHLSVRPTLTNYQRALQTTMAPELRHAKYFLLTLRPLLTSVIVSSYRKQELEKASDEYLATEKLIEKEPGSQAVLVSAESIAALLRAYPNYFLDTTVFLDELTSLLRS